MIPMEFQYGFYLYIAIWLLTIIILWAREMWREKAYDWELSQDRLCVCDGCHYAFLIKHNENITRCPRCNEMCILRKRQRF